ncbi:hypothetical protein LUZ28_24490 [Streptomyces albireticuli]|nr:hypothetical protein [Streptomyces albireticuli]MCD9143058.1 hypothetical protein [Streptomyces albireticuli]MCD9165301.1 hypothetical protein [Streptomyces albireticuli]MCD9192181.1 hypothetical protein [Streptomyces albireticuli]
MHSLAQVRRDDAVEPVPVTPREPRREPDDLRPISRQHELHTRGPIPVPRHTHKIAADPLDPLTSTGTLIGISTGREPSRRANSQLHEVRKLPHDTLIDPEDTRNTTRVKDLGADDGTRQELLDERDTPQPVSLGQHLREVPAHLLLVRGGHDAVTAGAEGRLEDDGVTDGLGGGDRGLDVRGGGTARRGDAPGLAGQAEGVLVLDQPDGGGRQEGDAQLLGRGGGGQQALLVGRDQSELALRAKRLEEGGELPHGPGVADARLDPARFQQVAERIVEVTGLVAGEERDAGRPPGGGLDEPEAGAAGERFDDDDVIDGHGRPAPVLVPAPTRVPRGARSGLRRTAHDDAWSSRLLTGCRAPLPRHGSHARPAAGPRGRLSSAHPDPNTNRMVGSINEGVI